MRKSQMKHRGKIQEIKKNHKYYKYSNDKLYQIETDILSKSLGKKYHHKRS